MIVIVIKILEREGDRKEKKTQHEICNRKT